MSINIPKAPYAIIGGSSTFSIKFPEALNEPDVDIIDDGLVFNTPFGDSPPFKYFKAGDKLTLTCKMHGWRSGVSRADASRQVFWVFKEAGVKKILAEGGVGAINHLLNPRDIIIPTDYIDNSMRKDVSLGSDYLLIMRKAICADLHNNLLQAAKQIAPAKVFERGIYAVTDGRHFESPAEVSVLKQWGADIVGQSLCPEVYLAREIGACYAGVYLVVNYAEGIVEDWKHEELSDIFYSESRVISRIIIQALRSISESSACECASLRKPTLLKESN
ncbi:MAG: MTAP family purine nucleoside phosphorylase [Firmicutes bacterium]|nr:MTAP family purine nucleoside phosphorylase [Bacillota bacterium]